MVKNDMEMKRHLRREGIASINQPVPSEIVDRMKRLIESVSPDEFCGGTMKKNIVCGVICLLVGLIFGLSGMNAQQPAAGAPNWAAPQEGDYVMREVRMHYTTLGKPMKDAAGRTTNAVLILHGTGGSGTGLLRPIFAGVLFGPGQLLDATKYFIILPDNIGHGKSSKPSDGLHARFPHYAYADMIALQHELLFKALGVNHLRLILGTSM